MPISIDARRVGEVIVVGVSGNIALGNTADLSQFLLERLVQGENKKILLNLAETHSIDTAGICELVSIHTRLSIRKISLKLLSPTQRVSEMLRITKLYSVFEIFENEEDAIRSFA